MKVSRNDIQRIYQDQVKKVRDDKSTDSFKKVMADTTSQSEATTKTFHPPSGLNASNPLIAGKPVPQADPVETLKFAAEVVANEPDVRTDKVARLKSLIDSGKYNVSSDKVAEKLLQSGIVTRSWEA